MDFCWSSGNIMVTKAAAMNVSSRGMLAVLLLSLPEGFTVSPCVAAYVANSAIVLQRLPRPPGHDTAT